jgi:hypothetical protein
MKKTLMTCLAIAALFAVAGSASAITCTIDQRPAATLLVPYFEVSVDPTGAILGEGDNARDTLVTICNASSAPMIAHATVWNERTELVLDFDIALTGFDCQSMSMARVVTGFLPSTPITTSHVVAAAPGDGDACQRNAAALSGVGSGRYIRIRPANTDTATEADNILATTKYPVPAWQPGSSFFWEVLDSLDETDDSVACDGIDQEIEGPIRGYVSFDHVNYCNLAAPGFPTYYTRDAIGQENNLFGEVIFTAGGGLPTMGGSTVNIEADPSLAGTASSDPRVRTFYARWVPAADTPCFGGNCALFAAALPGGGGVWNQSIGDQREPLGLRYAARWFDTAGVTSFFNVWRGSAGALSDLLGSPQGDCDDIEPTVTLTFYDEDENTVTSGVCPSPCRQPTFNFPLETQRRPITAFQHPQWPAGWVSMSFFNSGGPLGGILDQAWVEYDFQGAGAFLSASSPATQLDPSACNPLGIGDSVQVVTPAIPAVVGVGQ